MAKILAAVIAITMHTLLAAQPQYWNGNGGRWFEYVSDQLTFQQAEAAAAQRTYLGHQGYLATLMSWEELHAGNLAPSDGWAWVGAKTPTNGYGSAVEFIWFTGPEGQVPAYLPDGSWSSLPPCTAASIGPNGQPVPCIAGHAFLQVNGRNLWKVSGGQFEPAALAGYIVEYGADAPPTAAVPEISSSAQIILGLSVIGAILLRQRYAGRPKTNTSAFAAEP